MSTTRSDARAAAALALAGLLALGGCGGSGPTAAPVDPATSSPVAAAPAPAGPGSTGPVPDPSLGAVVEAPDVVAALTRTLGHRAAALREGDASAYRSGLADRDAAFVAQQEQYYANLRQLPLQVLTLVPDPATLERAGASYWVNVAVTTQLQGYDAVPVTTVDRYRFSPTATGRRYRLSSVTDAAWEARNAVTAPPWETGPVVVRAGAGVLGIFDAAGASAAGPLLASVERSIADVSARVPSPWSRSVVVYAFSDDAFLRSLPQLPGEDPDALDAVAVPVQARPDAPDIAAVRLVLHPRMLRRAGAGRDRLLRHELTHVALGTADDQAPVWLAEGLAEWVSVQAEAPEDRDVPRAALRAARSGFTDLPADDAFNVGGRDESAAHYALSWWACEYVASVGGPTAPWDLLARVEAGTPEEDALEAVAGVDRRTLARRAGKLLLAAFDPPAPVVPPVT